MKFWSVNVDVATRQIEGYQTMAQRHFAPPEPSCAVIFSAFAATGA